MDLSLTEQQKMLKKTARAFLEENCPKSVVRSMEEDSLGFPPQLWKRMADLGWLSLICPEQYGGAGGNFLDLSVILEEMGRALLPSPFLSTLMSALIILEGGTEEQKLRLLPQIADGKLIVIPAWDQPDDDDATLQFVGTSKGARYEINGSKLFVPYANAADFFISQVHAPDGAGSTLFLVNASKGPVSGQLLTIARDKQCEVRIEGVALSEDDILGESGRAPQYVANILPQVLVAKAIEMLGGAQQVLEMSVEHAKRRIQFDRPIGSFQAIQHHCANMAIDLDSARFLTYRVAWMVAQGLPCEKEAYMAKSWVSDAYRRISVLGKQIHGGHGIIAEYDLQLYLRRQKSDELFPCDSDFCRERIGEMIL